MRKAGKPFIKQAEIAQVLTENKKVCGVRTKLGAEYKVKALVIATGTYLKGKIHIGEESYESGPDSALPSTFLSDSLRENGIEIRRERLAECIKEALILIKWKNRTATMILFRFLSGATATGCTT